MDAFLMKDAVPVSSAAAALLLGLAARPAIVADLGAGGGGGPSSGQPFHRQHPLCTPQHPLYVGGMEGSQQRQQRSQLAAAAATHKRYGQQR